MKLLLTSGGITNPSLRRALEELLPRPVEECSALAIPTAQHGHPMCTPESAWRFVSGHSPAPMTELGWASVGLLELTALPSIPRDRWVPWVEAADVLLVDGGDATYLAHWLRRTELLAATRPDQVWVGISAGSMVLTPRIGSAFVQWTDAPDDRGLDVVGFSIFPHLDYPGWPDNTLAAARDWATQIGGESYLLDDQSGVRVSQGRVEVVSEGQWHHVGG